MEPILKTPLFWLVMFRVRQLAVFCWYTAPLNAIGNSIFVGSLENEGTITIWKFHALFPAIAGTLSCVQDGG